MPRPKRIFLTPDLITDDNRFEHRAGHTSTSHIDTLARTLRSNKRLDPIWVWQEVDENGKVTGTLVLMDGRHRLAAYGACFKKYRREQYLKIPAYIFEGTEVSAAIKALALNSKDKLALTHSEKLDSAWNIVVRDLKNEATKPMIAMAAGISERTVLNMRNKRNEIIIAGAQLPNTWTKARIWPEENEWTPLTDAQKEAEIKELTDALKEAMRTTRSRDIEIIAEAVTRTLGEPQITYMVDYLKKTRGEDYDEFDEDTDRKVDDEQTFCLASNCDF